MSLAGIADLPNELLSQICQELCYHCREDHVLPMRRRYCGRWVQDAWSRQEQRSLVSLSRSCKRLRHPAQSVLHHYLYAHREEDAFLFARTLLARPDLCTVVRELEIVRWAWCDQTSADSPELAKMLTQVADDQLGRHMLGDFWHDSDSDEEGDGYDSDQYHGGDRYIDPPTHGALGEVRRGVYCSTLFCILLYLATHCTRIHLRLGQYCNFSTLERSGMHSLSLRQAAFSYSGRGRQSLLLDQIAPILRRAPNLEALHCHGFVGVSELFCASIGQETVDDPPALANLAELRLSVCEIPATSLSRLMTAIGPRLTHLDLQFTQGYFKSVYVMEDFIPNPIQVNEAISPWCKTLKSLSLRLLDHMPEPHFPRDYMYTMQHFDRLETLELHTSYRGEHGWYDARVMTDFLPRSIRTLKLLGSGHRWCKGIKRLAEAKLRGEFAQLAEVVCTGFPEEDSVTEEDDAGHEQLKRLFKTAHVHFRVRIPEKMAVWSI